MSVGMGLIGGEDLMKDTSLAYNLSGRAGRDAAEDSARHVAEAQMAALNYLREREAIPQQFREGALTSLAGIAGLEGGTGSQQELIDRAMQSPLYSQLTGGIDDYRTRAIREMEESILRNRAASGGLRSGNTQRALADNISQIEEQAEALQRQALTQSYNEQTKQLSGLAGLANNSQQIANAMVAPAESIASGAIAGANARQQGVGNIAGIIGSVFSDPALKSDIELIGKRNGLNWYRWVWNEAANALGLLGESEGVMADEVREIAPDAVSSSNGYMTVDYGKLGV